MNYIRRNISGIEIDREICNDSLLKYLNTLCIKSFSTFEGRVNASEKILNKKSNVPIFVDEYTVLFPTERIRNYDSCYINSKNVLTVKKVCKKISRVVFSDLTEVFVYCSLNKMKLQLEQSRKLLEK